MFLPNPTKKIFLELEYFDHFMWLLILLGDLLWESGSHDYGGWEAAQSAICELNYSGIIQSKSKSLRTIWANGANISMRSREDDMSYLSSNSEARKKSKNVFSLSTGSSSHSSPQGVSCPTCARSTCTLVSRLPPAPGQQTYQLYTACRWVQQTELARLSEELCRLSSESLLSALRIPD